MKRALAIALTLGFLSGCVFSSQKRDLQNGEQSMSEGHSGKAFIYFERAAHGSDSALALEGARRAARLAHFELKKYQKAIDLYRMIIVNSDNEEERKLAQKHIAQIYFENLLYYDKAIIEYEKLLRLDFTPAEKYQFRMNVAKSNHQLGNLDQALAELDTLSKEKPNENDYYDLEVFKSNVLMSQKKQKEAAGVLEGLIAKYPEKSQKESLAITLAVAYEEVDDFKKAIETLETMKNGYSHPEFLDARIARLKARMSNMPGAQGLKK